MTPNKTTPILTLETSRRQTSPASTKQSKARAALEALLGAPLRDPEWDRIRARLLEFGAILREWSQQITAGDVELPNAA
jgi:hypothetical protein